MIIRSDARFIPLRDGCVQCCVTSPPYFGLRDYQTAGQIGLEASPEAYVAALVAVFREVWRVLRDDGTLWLNLGDSYAGSGKGGNPEDSPRRKQATNYGSLFGRPWRSGDEKNERNGPEANRNGLMAVNGYKPKDLCGIPWRVAFALQADGWYLRSDIIWSKANPMPESVTDRPTKAHEYLFLLAKSERYYYDAAAIAEPSVYQNGEGGHQRFGASGGKAEIAYGRLVSGQVWNSDGTRNARSVWTINPEPYAGAHYATFPQALVTRCILAGSKLGDLVLDPFGGTATVGLVAERLGRRWICSDLAYHDLAKKRTAQRGIRWKESAQAELFSGTDYGT